MGSPLNIVIQQRKGPPLYLYSHDGRDETIHALVTALHGWRRLYDPAYFARILFCELVKNDVGGELGWGIQTWQPNTGVPDITLKFEEGPLLTVEVDGIPLLPINTSAGALPPTEAMWFQLIQALREEILGG